MNKLSREKQAQIIAALVEGNSINSTVRMTGASKVTILKLLASLGVACADYQDRTLRNLNCKRIQCDEVWQFCYAKEKNVPEEKKGRFGYGAAGQFEDRLQFPGLRLRGRNLANPAGDAAGQS